MIYERKHKGLTIQIEGYWSEVNDSNIYKWRVINSQRVIPLESRVPFTDWNECYRDATAAIDEYTCSTDSNSLKT